MSSICVIGTGYVGLVAIASFAELGHTVTGLDIDTGRIAALRQGVVPFFEPGLDDLLNKEENAGRIRFTTEYASAVPDQDFIFICVNTPPDRKGQPRMNQITSAARALAQSVTEDTIIVNKSTGPIGMVDLIRHVLAEHDERLRQRAIVANPEFLNQGRAVYDFLHPHQVVIGSENAEAAEAVARLYEPLDAPIVFVEHRAAEMTKLVSNAFRAMKVSFVNEVATICEQIGVDVTQVAKLLSADQAIGASFLGAGVGWGGNCLPKDVTTLQHVAKTHGVRPHMLRAASRINMAQRVSVVSKTRALLGDVAGKRIGALGLAFKGGTDDIRESPAMAVVRQLAAAGAELLVHDPMAMNNARRVLDGNVTFCDDPYQVTADADAVLLLTDCPEYRALDLGELAGAMRQRNLVDGRNFFEPARLKEAGFTYVGIGRGYPAHGSDGAASIAAEMAEVAPEGNDAHPGGLEGAVA